MASPFVDARRLVVSRPRAIRDRRRILAILLLGATGGLALALLWERDTLAGSDALAYWTAVHRWLAGTDIYQAVPDGYVAPSEGALPYAYSPWSLYLFLPWALLPWDVAWVAWRAANICLFAASVAWAYRQRPLGTAVLVTLLSPSVAANLDTGNINILIALAAWIGYWSRGRIGGALWAVGTALKFVPVALLPFMRREGWLPGLAIVGVLGVLTLATWPETVRQFEVVLNYPRPFRLDYLVLAWAVVPWLYARSWPPRLSRDWLEGIRRRDTVGQPTAAPSAD